MFQTSSPEEYPPPPPSLHTAYITLEWKVSKIPSAWIPGETHIFQKGMFLTETAPAGNSSWHEGSTALEQVQAQPGRNDLHPNSETVFHMADLFLSNSWLAQNIVLKPCTVFSTAEANLNNSLHYTSSEILTQICQVLISEAQSHSLNQGFWFLSFHFLLWGSNLEF